MDQENKKYSMTNDRYEQTSSSSEYKDIIITQEQSNQRLNDQPNSNKKPENVEDVGSFLHSIYAKNPSARNFMDNIENLFSEIFASNDFHRNYTFPTMSSFQRLIIHRFADYFKMVHFLDPTGNVCVIKKTNSINPIPVRTLYENSVKVSGTQEQPKIKILKKPKIDFITENPQIPVHAPTRSLEERQESYLRARARIFQLPLDDSNMIDHFTASDLSQENEGTSLNIDLDLERRNNENLSLSSNDTKMLFQKCIQDAASKKISEKESRGDITDYVVNDPDSSQSVINTQCTSRLEYFPLNYSLQENDFQSDYYPFENAFRFSISDNGIKRNDKNEN